MIFSLPIITAITDFIVLVAMPLATFSVIFYVLLIIANWRIFEKAGEAGWKSIIPIYNVYIMFKIVKMKNWFWWLIALGVCALIMIILDGYGPYIMNEFQEVTVDNSLHLMSYIAVFGMSIAVAWTVVTCAWRTAKVFGHGVGFMIGLLLLPNLFQIILGFGGSKYNKKRLKK